MNLLNWHETGHSPELMGAWLCDAGDRELVVLQRSPCVTARR